jgi:hypothetical protein
MKTVNKMCETITEYDLSKGFLRTMRIIRSDAIPLGTKISTLKDGKEVQYTKKVWNPDDYETVQMYFERKEKTAEEKIIELKTKLSSTDYKIIKCSECQLLGEPMPYDIVTLHAER